MAAPENSPRPDAQPFSLYAPNSVPLVRPEDIKAMLDKMVSQRNIALVGGEASAWCHPVVVVRIKSGGRFSGLCTHSPSPYSSVMQVGSG